MGLATAPATLPMPTSLWNLGFRPFYLAASAFATLSVGLWALQYAGLAPGALPGPAWHGHEMVFGFAMAVIAGFLLTAVRNWTQRPTPTGWPLAALVLLWAAGRLLVMTPFHLTSLLANAAFPLALAWAIGGPLLASGNRRNYFFIALLVGISVVTGLFHLAAMGAVAWSPGGMLRIGLDIVLFVVTVLAGRVIPMFTNNGVPGAGATRRDGLERASLGSVLLLLVLDAAQAGGGILAAAAFASAMLHAARLALWRPLRTLRVPLVWVLHAAYAWIPVHLALRAGAAAEWIAEPVATHALTVGAIGAMTLGMMTRTARGHTGRPLQADAWEVAAYALVLLAGTARVLVPLALPPAYATMVGVSAAAWAGAFGIYFFRYWPILTSPRADGREG